MVYVSAMFGDIIYAGFCEGCSCVTQLLEELVMILVWCKPTGWCHGDWLT
jgi:hypothetical protein